MNERRLESSPFTVHWTCRTRVLLPPRIFHSCTCTWACSCTQAGYCTCAHPHATPLRAGTAFKSSAQVALQQTGQVSDTLSEWAQGASVQFKAQTLAQVCVCVCVCDRVTVRVCMGGFT